jgi:hypothetical protein
VQSVQQYTNQYIIQSVQQYTNQYIIQSVQQYTNQFSVKFKILYLTNNIVCVLWYFRQDILSILLLSHFGWIITQLEKEWIIIVMLCGSSSHRNTSKLESWQVLDTPVMFRERWNFSNIIGCVDGKHIHIKCPTKAGSLFYNYKHFPPVADSESRFNFIDIGACGKLSEKVDFLLLLHITSWKTMNLSYQACKFWGKWNRNAFRHPWWWGLSSKDVPNDTFSRERICHAKKVFSVTGCREQGDALFVPLIS